jgi:hypothetical protein
MPLLTGATMLELGKTVSVRVWVDVSVSVTYQAQE